MSSKRNNLAKRKNEKRLKRHKQRRFQSNQRTKQQKSLPPEDVERSASND